MFLFKFSFKSFKYKNSTPKIMAVKVAKLKKCPECGSDKVIHNKKGELVCQDCGLVFAELVPEKEKQEEKASDII